MDYHEGTHEEILKAREIVFLADVQKNLRETHGIYELSLRVQTVPGDYGTSRYLIATNRRGEEITSQNSDNRGQHGLYLHPWNKTATPETVAVLLFHELHRYKERLAKFADGHRVI